MISGADSAMQIAKSYSPCIGMHIDLELSFHAVSVMRMNVVRCFGSCRLVGRHVCQCFGDTVQLLRQQSSGTGSKKRTGYANCVSCWLVQNHRLLMLPTTSSAC